MMEDALSVPLKNVRSGASSKRRMWRQWWLKVHRWLGVGVGLLWVLLGLTGSINVFRWDIDEWLNPALVVESPGDRFMPIDDIYRKLLRAHPEAREIWSLEMPRHRAGMLMARYLVKMDNGETKLLFVSLDPYSGAIVTERFYADSDFLVTWIYELHSTLFLGNTGSNMVGVAGLFLLVSLGSGFYLWWPRTGKFRQALTFRRSASSQKLVYDIHKMFGVYGMLLLCLIAFSGACLVFSSTVHPLVATLSPVYGGFNPQPAAPDGLRSVKKGNATPISADRAIAIALEVFPDAVPRFVKTPADTKGIYAVQLRQPNEASQFFTTTSVWVDQYTGDVLATRDPNQFTYGEVFLNLLWPIHNGEVLGITGRVLVLITGLAPLILFITGVIRWRQKERIGRTSK